MTATVLVTGGAGYIGSHACVVLQEAGYRVVELDNLCNSNAQCLDRVAQICGRRPESVLGDLRDGGCLDAVFRDHDIAAVMHFAGLKAVGESVAHPLMYYANNVAGSLSLLEAMERAGVETIVFSSSATVYGDPEHVPIPEDSRLCPSNPYGWTKRIVEQMLRDWQGAAASRAVCLLRYFNPVGAHPSGLIGEDPRGEPNNLMPYVAQVAVGRRDSLRVFGGDYPTPDGTGVRDYIHVMDLVEGHVAALEHLMRERGLHTFNLGTGLGVSVLELVRAFEAASGRSIPYEVVGRRAGDVASCWADAGRAARELQWRAKRGLDVMCADTWRWQSANPGGYA